MRKMKKVKSSRVLGKNKPLNLNWSAPHHLINLIWQKLTSINNHQVPTDTENQKIHILIVQREVFQLEMKLKKYWINIKKKTLKNNNKTSSYKTPNKKNHSKIKG